MAAHQVAWVAGNLTSSPERPTKCASTSAGCPGQGLTELGGMGGRKQGELCHLCARKEQAPLFLPISLPTRLLAPLFSQPLPFLLPAPPPSYSPLPGDKPVGSESLGRDVARRGTEEGAN